MLLIREQEEPYNGQWVLPQGYVKAGETVEGAARREVREELGVEVELGDLVGVYDDFLDETTPPTHCVIVGYRGSIRGTGRLLSTSEAIDSAWVDISKGLPDVPPVVRRMLADIAPRGGRRGRAKR